MNALEPYLYFDGTCAEAMRFYERVLGGKLETLMTHAESPMAEQSAPENAHRVLHATLSWQGRRLMAADIFAGERYQGMKGFSLSLGFATVAEGKGVFDALAAGGQITMPLEKTFWAEGFGMLVDRFGTPWIVKCGDPTG